MGFFPNKARLPSGVNVRVGILGAANLCCSCLSIDDDRVGIRVVAKVAFDPPDMVAADATKTGALTDLVARDVLFGCCCCCSGSSFT